MAKVMFQQWWWYGDRKRTWEKGIVQSVIAVTVGSERHVSLGWTGHSPRVMTTKENKIFIRWYMQGTGIITARQGIILWPVSKQPTVVSTRVPL